MYFVGNKIYKKILLSFISKQITKYIFCMINMKKYFLCKIYFTEVFSAWKIRNYKSYKKDLEDSNFVNKLVFKTIPPYWVSPF